MGKVRLGLKKMPILDKIALATRIVTAMTGNPNFATPNPALADITAKTTALRTSYNAALSKRAQAKAATDLQDADEKELDLKLTQASLYVENVSAGNDGKILSAGMNLRHNIVRIGELSVPKNLLAKAGGGDGEIILNWDPVRGARSYVVEITTDANVPSSWKHKTNVTESSAAITGLTSGGKFWFRVAGVGAAGQGPFSDPAAKYAP
ncbi:MAG TPA: fibronectin type III domain-containing protein [Planctomycetota bacterium]|nr:fibronectin type III domain-containing protein [Planctomycetota bacterium]